MKVVSKVVDGNEYYDLEILWRKVGRRIRKRREKVGLSQRQLAIKCNMHPSGIGNLEAGRQRMVLDNLIKICREIEYSISDCLKGF